MNVNQCLTLMYAYQKENNIAGKSVANVDYLFTLMRHIDPKTKACPKTVICCTVNEAKQLRCFVHVIIMLDDNTFIDPSYEVHSVEDKQYYDKIASFVSINEKLLKSCDRAFPQALFKQFIEHTKMTEQLAAGNLVPKNKDVEYLTAQSDYIHANFKP